MQIAFWSNMHGQAATTANTVAASCMIAQKTAYRILVAQNHIEKNALESYFLRKREQAAIKMLDYTNQGIDALIRLYKNGRLKSEMVPDYTYSLMKNHSLDLLFGSEKKENLSSDSENILLNIFECAKESYDLIILDLHSGLNDTNSRILLENSDIIIYCLCQNRNLLEDFKRLIAENPIIKSKRSAYILSRYEKSASFTSGNIAREFGIDSKSLFTIPNHVGFMDACNSGRVFDFITFGLQSKKGADFEFIQSFNALTEYIMKGCSIQS